MHIVYFELINQDILKQIYLKNQNMSGRSPNQQSPGSTRQSFFFMFFGKSIELINSGKNVDINGTSLKIKFTVLKGSQILNTLREPHLMTLNLGWSKLEKIQLAFLIKDSVGHQNTDFTIQMSAIDGQTQESIDEVQIQSEKYTKLLNEGINKVEQQTNFGNYKVKFIIFTDKSRHNLEKIVKAYRTSQQFVQLSKDRDNKSATDILEKANIQVQVFNAEAEQTKEIKHNQISPITQKQQNKWQKVEIEQKVQSNINDEINNYANEDRHEKQIQKPNENLKNIEKVEDEEQEKMDKDNREQVSEVLVHDRNKSLSDVAQVLEENYHKQEIKQNQKNNEDISAEINVKEQQQLKMGTNDVAGIQSPSDFVEQKNGQVSQIKIKQKPSIDYSEIQQISMAQESPFKLNKEQSQAQLNKKQSKKSGGMLGSQYFDRKADYYEPLKISQQQQYEVQPQKKVEKQQKNSSKQQKKFSGKTTQQKSSQQETQDPDMIQTESVMQGTSQVDMSQVVETIDGRNIGNKTIQNKGSDLKLTFKILLFFLILGFGAVFVARNLGGKELDSAGMDKPKGKSKSKGRSHKKGK